MTTSSTSGCEMEGGSTELCGRPVKVRDLSMEPFTRTLAVRFMSQEDGHTVKRRETPNCGRG